MNFVCCCHQEAPSVTKERLEQERQEGQALLRAMAEGDTVDWHAIIVKADELHAREQEYLRIRQCSSRDRRKFQRKALQKRRKYDMIGSFSVNMLTYRMDDKKSATETESKGSTRDDEGSFASSQSDDVIIGMSSSSSSSSSGMDVIDEQLEADSY